MIQIEAKEAAAGLAPQVAQGERHHAHVHRDLTLAAHAAQAPGFQHA